MRILLVEDDKALGHGIHMGLRHAGYAVDWVQDGLMAETAMDTQDYDVAVLDINLPKKSGLEVLDHVRAGEKSLPILLLTAKDSINDRIIGLDRGADDYMIKPFDLDELTARIRAVLRRSSGRSVPVLKYRNIELDPSSHTVKQGEKVVDLSSREFSTLQMLMENTGRVLSRHRLEESLYSWKDEIESNAIEVHIHRLRKKLGPDMIRTIRGVGYIMDKVQ